MPERICSIPDCDKPSRSRGWCQGHYSRWQRCGDPVHVPQPRPPRKSRTRDDIAENFWAKVNKTETCWLWTASRNKLGYGKFSVQRKMQLAHRVAYEWMVGPIPEGLVLDHLCRVSSCVNPDHLEAVTQRVNVARGNLPLVIGDFQRAKTHCPQGHPYDAANTHVLPQGWRKCRTCRRARHQRWVRRKADQIDTPSRNN